MATFCASHVDCVRGERPIFHGLSFHLESAGALVLIGPNGAGKSSLLRILAGLLPPSAGSIAWDGVELAKEPATHRSRVAFLGHGDAVKPALTVGEQMVFWSRFRDGGEDSDQRVAAALDRFGLTRLESMPARFLSAGQKRRLALARLLLVEVPLWLLDEPKTALDRDAAHRLDDAIDEHRRRGGMVVLSTHGADRPGDAVLLDLADFRAGAAC